jgi:hypothetical protein
MTERAILPTRRPSWRRKFGFASDPNKQPMTYFGTVSYFGEPPNIDEKRPYEVFVDCRKQTSDAAFQAEAAAIFASFALQYGCPLEKLVEAAPRLENGPNGEPRHAEPVGAFLRMVSEGGV